MLETFMTNTYAVENYQALNDRLLYVDYIRQNYTFNQQAVEPIDAYRYEGNLFGLFNHMGVQPSLYIYAMYLNGYTNPMSYEGRRTVFTVPITLPIPEN